MFSPTVSTSEIFTLLSAISNKNYKIASMDVLSAYPNTKRDDFPVLYMKISKEVTKYILALDKSYNICVGNNGCAIVKLTCGLYGLIESASFWYYHMQFNQIWF
jgi:hypothetical protein